MVDFTFSNTKTWNENTKYKALTYRKAIDLARDRRNYGRYKNFEFIIG